MAVIFKDKSIAHNMYLGCRKIRPCPSINPGCVSSNPKSSNFSFPWRILGYSSNGAAIQVTYTLLLALMLIVRTSDLSALWFQQLKDAILKTQKNAKIQLVEDTPSGESQTTSKRSAYLVKTQTSIT